MRRLLLLLIMFGSGHVQAQQLSLDIYAPAENTCADWKRSSASPALRNQYFIWFLGFVSGHNYMSMERQVPRVRLPDEGQFAVMVDKACAANPQQTLSVVALRFVDMNRPSAKGPKS